MTPGLAGGHFMFAIASKFVAGHPDR